MNGWSCSSKHGPAHFTVLKTLLIWMVWSFSQTFEVMGGPCSPKHGPVFFTVLKNLFVWMLCSHLNTIKLMAERAPQHPLTRLSSFCGVEESFLFDVMQTCNNNQMNGRLCSPKHGPGHFTVLKNLFVWMVWNFSKTFERMAGLCSPKHRPVLFAVLKILFVWMFCSHVKTFKLMAGPRSPTSPVTAQLSFRRWRIVSFWCYADIQQRSNERTFVLPQTRSRAFHGVKELFRLDSMKLFKNIPTYGWAVLPQTRPSSVHGVDWVYFYGYFAAMQKHLSLWLGRAPQHPLSRPSSFRGVEESFRSDVMQTFNNVQTNGWSCSPKHGPAHFMVLKNLFHLDGMKLFKNIQTYGWTVLPQTRPSSVHGVEESICIDVLQPC